MIDNKGFIVPCTEGRYCDGNDWSIDVSKHRLVYEGKCKERYRMSLICLKNPRNLPIEMKNYVHMGSIDYTPEIDEDWISSSEKIIRVYKKMKKWGEDNVYDLESRIVQIQADLVYI